MVINIELPQSMKQQLEKIARRNHRTADECARDALLQYIEDAEDLYEAERILRRVRSGWERTFTLDEVSRRLEL